MLVHYSTRMDLNTLRFDQVRSDDPSITGPNYVDIPVEAFPVPQGSNFWWEKLPPSSELSLIFYSSFPFFDLSSSYLGSSKSAHTRF